MLEIGPPGRVCIIASATVTRRILAALKPHYSAAERNLLSTACFVVAHQLITREEWNTFNLACALGRRFALIDDCIADVVHQVPAFVECYESLEAFELYNAGVIDISPDQPPHTRAAHTRAAHVSKRPKEAVPA
jgi:hypothetical protein